MARARPCRICRKWFVPHPRVGGRQRACGRGECQRERHRRACESWRGRNPDYDREERLRRRLVREGEPKTAAGWLEANPLGWINWTVARGAVGLAVAVTVEETGRLLHGWVRDAVCRQLLTVQGDRR